MSKKIRKKKASSRELDVPLKSPLWTRPGFLVRRLHQIHSALFFEAHIVYIWMVTVVFHARRTAMLPLISGASGAVNVAVNIVLIPRFGIEGAAWATLARIYGGRSSWATG